MKVKAGFNWVPITYKITYVELGKQNDSQPFEYRQKRSKMANRDLKIIPVRIDWRTQHSYNDTAKTLNISSQILILKCYT